VLATFGQGLDLKSVTVNFFPLTGLKMIIRVAFCGYQAAKVTIYSDDEIEVKVRVFPTRKNCLFFLTGLKMVVGVGFCKIKVDSNFLLVLKIKCTKFHQDRSKTVDLHTKYTNKQTFSFIYIDCKKSKIM
jgi:hypothetical protein